MSRNKELVSAGQVAVVFGSVILLGAVVTSCFMAGPAGTVLDALWAMRMPILASLTMVAIGVFTVKFFGAKAE